MAVLWRGVYWGERVFTEQILDEFESPEKGSVKSQGRSTGLFREAQAGIRRLGTAMPTFGLRARESRLVCFQSPSPWLGSVLVLPRIRPPMFVRGSDVHLPPAEYSARNSFAVVATDIRLAEDMSFRTCLCNTECKSRIAAAQSPANYFRPRNFSAKR